MIRLKQFMPCINIKLSRLYSNVEKNEVIGYTIGCDVKKLKSTFQKELAATSSETKAIISSEKMLYLRHVAKKADKKQVGEKLLQTLLEQAKQLGYKYVICTIAHQPFQNKASITFHEKYGFICMGYKQDEERKYGVYLKKI